MSGKRGQRNKNVNHGKTQSKVRRQPGGMYETKLQLVQSELVSQLSIMAPPGRKGDKIHNSPQHTGTGCSLIKTPTRRYRHDMSKRIHPICMQGISQSRGLGRWCSWQFFCNPNHVSRIVVAYRTCRSKVKGLRIIYQQQLRYIQAHGINCSPVELFDRDLAKQIKEWRKSGEWIVLVMDVNDHPLTSKFYQQLQKEQTALEEFTHKCWGPIPPYTHISGSSPIDGGYKSSEIEIVNLGMLTFAESPGDHRSFIINISTRSLFGEFRFTICRPVSRRLVTSQQQSVARYNKVVREQFEIRRIVARLDAVDKMTRYCGYPSPNWLRAMIIKLYKQMPEIRVHAEKDCRKILRPESDFSPTIQMWYDRIHAYLQLIRLKEGKASNDSNILQFAKRTHIERPAEPTMEELEDGLQFCRIRKADLRQQAKGLRKVHLRDCLFDAQS
jgi:hypothetical protein